MKRNMFRTGCSCLYWLLAALCLLPGIGASAQGENNIWHFGMGHSLNFNTGAPVLGASNIQVIEGAASVCNENGSLLFYSDGQHVWNKNGNLMPNGSGLLGNGGSFGLNGSTTQGVVIVKSLANPAQYYIFTLEANEDMVAGSNSGHLWYTVVDLSFNNGLGDVVAAQKNILLDNMQSEKMVVVKGSNCNYWLVTHDILQIQYRAFKIDANGVNVTPVISNVGLPNPQIVQAFPGPYICGELEVSHDGKKMAMVSTTSHFIEMTDFDAATGMLSNAVMIDSIGNSGLYGVEFSPDNSKLYIANVMPIHPDGLMQYDLSLLPNIAAVRASRVAIAPGTYNGMRTGPDGKIYVAQMTGAGISCIQNPNQQGTACNFAVNSIPYGAVAGLTGGGLGSPVVITVSDTSYHKTDTTSCAPAIVLNAPQGYADRVWQDGSKQLQYTATNSGPIWCVSNNGCEVRVDSFYVHVGGAAVDLGADTSICPGDVVNVELNVSGATYLWNNGSVASFMHVTTPGKYYVTVTTGNCTTSDTLMITPRMLQLTLGKDTTLCLGKTMILSAKISGTYLWQDNSTADNMLVTTPGSYWVEVKQGGCTAADTVVLDYINCNCSPVIPTVFSPNGDGLNDLFAPAVACPIVNYNLVIANRWGERVFISYDAKMKWDGTQTGAPAAIGTYYYMLTYWEPNGKQHNYKGDITVVR